MANHIIINPASAGGKTGRREDEILRLAERFLPGSSIHRTEHCGGAVGLVRQLGLSGDDSVFVVGGDGTINEVVNGLVDQKGEARLRPILGVLPSGSGGDFRRTFAISRDIEEAFQRVAKNQPILIDLGKVIFINGSERLFANISSTGLSAEIGVNTNRARWLKKINGTLAFNWTIVSTSLKHKRFGLVVKTPENPEGILWDANCIAICNGQYFGSGVRVACEADPGDGFLDVVIVHGLSPLGFLKGVAQIKKDDSRMPAGMAKLRTQWIEISSIAPDREVLIETDGEFAGTLPARFEAVPSAIRLF